jgi:hypothetical protein
MGKSLVRTVPWLWSGILMGYYGRVVFQAAPGGGIGWDELSGICKFLVFLILATFTFTFVLYFLCRDRCDEEPGGPSVSCYEQCDRLSGLVLAALLLPLTITLFFLCGV